MSEKVEPVNLKGILKLYFLVLFLYLFPFVSLGIFLLGSIILEADMLFWVIFLVSLLPCGGLGLILSIIGFVISRKRKSKLNKIIGVIGLFGGMCMIIAGILALMLIYVVIS